MGQERTTSRQLLRIARMRRDRERIRREVGARLFEVELADCHWGVYQMLGRLCSTMYLLRRDGRFRPASDPRSPPAPLR